VLNRIWLLLAMGFATQMESKQLLSLPLRREIVNLPRDHSNIQWLDPATPGVGEFIDQYGGGVAPAQASTAAYYTMPSSVHAELRAATQELHRMFIEATRHVLRWDGKIACSCFVRKR